MNETPQPQHDWLTRIVGLWEVESESVMGPDQAPIIMRGRESVRSLGGLWLVAEMKADESGGGMQSIMTLGYDPKAGTFRGTFIADCMTHLWVYERGSLDATGNVLTMEAEGPAFDGSGMARYQDIIEQRPDGTRTLTARVLKPDGQWLQFMKATYRRIG